MNAERKLSKVKIALMRNPKFAFWSGILMVGRTSVVDGMPTAATNGRDEYYGREFVEQINEKELAFVILHEAMHKCYRHMTTWKKLHDEHPMLANAAMDYVINLELADMEKATGALTFPVLEGRKLGLIDEKFRGMNTKQVYDLLKEEIKQGFGRGEGNPLDEHDWEGAENLTDEEKKALEKEIDQAIRQGVMAEKRAGLGAGNRSLELEDLLNPQVNWREVLREYVKSICAGKDASSWRKVNRRFLSSDTYMPTLISERVGHLVVAVDTSGSIGGRELSNFLSEVKSIADEVTPDKVDLLYWDCEVAGHEEYDSSTVGSIVDSTKPRGGGGTSPSCVSRYLREKGITPECIIVLTDGYVGADWGTGWEAPVLWTIAGNSGAVAPVGQTIHIND